MNKLEMLKGMLEALGEDVSFSISTDGHWVHVDLCDFEGFDSNWDEIFRDYDHPKEVKAFKEWLWLESSCVTSCDDLYQKYDFEDFSVVLGYTSMDI